MKNKKKLLEWVTAEDADKNSKTDLNSYYKEMRDNVYFGTLFLFFASIIGKVFGIFWIIAPIVAWYISLDNERKEEITETNRRY